MLARENRFRSLKIRNIMFLNDFNINHMYKKNHENNQNINI